jgi:hypothetical protein
VSDQRSLAVARRPIGASGPFQYRFSLALSAEFHAGLSRSVIAKSASVCFTLTCSLSDIFCETDASGASKTIESNRSLAAVEPAVEITDFGTDGAAKTASENTERPVVGEGGCDGPHRLP